MAKRWFPLESNPEVMTLYAGRLGLDVSSSGLWFHDLLSTEDWAREMVPKPVLGVLMLFPIKDQVSPWRSRLGLIVLASLVGEVQRGRKTSHTPGGTVRLTQCAHFTKRISLAFTGLV